MCRCAPPSILDRREHEAYRLHAAYLVRLHEPMIDLSKTVQMPAETLARLHATLRAELDEAASVSALQRAGFEAGNALYARFETAHEGVRVRLDTADLWQRVSHFFDELGWGALAFDDAHPGVGLLRSADWTEAAPSHPVNRPSCAFSAGMLSQFLSRLAGAPVAVLEVECRSCGDSACSFAFGSEATIQAVHQQMRDGHLFTEALAALA